MTRLLQVAVSAKKESERNFEGTKRVKVKVVPTTFPSFSCLKLLLVLVSEEKLDFRKNALQSLIRLILL